MIGVQPDRFTVSPKLGSTGAARALAREGALRDMEPAAETCVTSRSERMVFDDEIVAVSLLTSEEVRVLGSSLKQVYPVPRDGKFEDLLRALDREVPRPRTSSQAPD